MSAGAQLVWMILLGLLLAFGIVMAENAYWTWVRPWRARRQWERQRRLRGRHW